MPESPLLCALTEDILLGLLLRQQGSTGQAPTASRAGVGGQEQGDHGRRDTGKDGLDRQGSYTEVALATPIPTDTVGNNSAAAFKLHLVQHPIGGDWLLPSMCHTHLPLVGFYNSRWCLRCFAVVTTWSCGHCLTFHVLHTMRACECTRCYCPLSLHSARRSSAQHPFL